MTEGGPGSVKRISIRTKLQLAITGLMLAVCAATMYVFRGQAESFLLDQMRARLSVVAQSAAMRVDGDELSSITSRADETSSRYRRIRRDLQRVKAANPDIHFIYTMRPRKHSRMWEFVVDADPDPKSVAHVGDDYDASQLPELRAGLSCPTADSRVVHDRWGDFVSGYAPVTDGAGRSVGIVGVDLSAAQLAAETAHIRQVGLVCTLTGTLLALLLVSAISALLLSPISGLIERLNAASKGCLEPVEQAARNDEIGDVARTFNQLLSALRHKDEMLSAMNSDCLTGVMNHRYFHQLLHESVTSARERNGTVALLMVDLDKFRMVNDCFGHAAGDEILKQVAKSLPECVPQEHSIARYAGEEFAVILPGAGMQVGVDAAERICRTIAANRFLIPGGPSEALEMPVTLTVSIGVAVYPTHCTDADGLTMAADIALYRAKHLGRDRVCSYGSLDQEAYADPYQAYAFIQDPTKAAIEALAAAVDARDRYTRHHSENVSTYATRLAERIGLSPSEVDLLRMTSLLHDVGKIGIPDYILNKPGALTEEEMAVIRTHPTMGEVIVRSSRNLEGILPGVLHHHERFDGTGYPHGLSGQDIPIQARIIAIADAFDALTTTRPYRESLSVADALEVLKENSGAQFDPDLVPLFIEIVTHPTSSAPSQAA